MYSRDLLEISFFTVKFYFTTSRVEKESLECLLCMRGNFGG